MTSQAGLGGPVQQKRSLAFFGGWGGGHWGPGVLGKYTLYTLYQVYKILLAEGLTRQWAVGPVNFIIGRSNL